MEKIFDTAAVCPACKKRIAAIYARERESVFFIKNCPEHGEFKEVVWEGDLKKWCAGWEPKAQDNPDCPALCGLCHMHRNDTCCTVLDITAACDLRCPVCFASAGEGEDVPFDEIKESLDDIIDQGRRFLHLSGGEPTVHKNIEEITAYARKAGFEYIQLNSNGLRLAREEGFAEKIKKAGTSCVFLQFDGVSDGTYRKIRGRALYEEKKKAIENCKKAELGVVLVPTLIPRINDSEIGGIIRFALENTPAVRGIHFQPVAYTGRFEELFADGSGRQHLTMSSLMDEIERQTGGIIKKEDIYPSVCDSPLCGFHGEFRIESGQLRPSAKKEECCCCCCGSPQTEKNQSYVKNRWTLVESGDYEEGSLDALLKTLSDQTFSISAMAFMDIDTFDIGRVMQCSVNVYKNGRFIPFCTENVIRERQE